MMRDFKTYKERTNALFDRLQKQYSKEIMTNTARLDQVELQTNRNRDRMEVIDAEFQGF